MVVQTGHMAEVLSVVFAREHPLVVSTGKDNSVILWHWLTGRKLRHLAGHKRAPGLLKFIFHDSLLVTAGERLIVFNVLNGEKIFDQDAEQFDVDEQEGRILYVANDSLKVFEIRTRKSIFITFDNKYGFVSAKFQAGGVVAVASGARPLMLYRLNKGLSPHLYFNKELFALPIRQIATLNDSLIIVDIYSESDTGEGVISKIVNIRNPEASPPTEFPGYYAAQWSSQKYFVTKNNLKTFIWRRDNLGKMREFYGVEQWFLKGDSILINVNSFSYDPFKGGGMATKPSYWMMTNAQGKDSVIISFPTLNRVYVNMIKSGKTFFNWFYKAGGSYIDTTVIFDEGSPAARQYIPGKYVGYDDQQKLVAVLSGAKKNTAFSIYYYGDGIQLVKNFEPPAFDYPVSVNRSGDTLEIRTNNENIIQYNYSEKLARLTSTVSTFFSRFEKDDKSHWMKYSFEKENDFRTDSVVFNIHNKFHGYILLYAGRRQNEHIFLNNDDTLIYFNAGNFKTSRLVVPQLFYVDYFDEVSGILGLSIYDGGTVFYNVRDLTKPILTTERLPVGTYIFSGSNYVVARIKDSLHIHNLVNGTSYKFADKYTRDIAGHLELYDNLSNKIYLFNILTAKKIIFPPGSRLSPILRSRGTTEEHEEFILVHDNDKQYSIIEVNDKQKIRFKFRDDGYQGISAAFISDDGKYLFTVDYEFIIRQWNFRSGKLIQSFAGHSSDITALLWSSQSERLYTASKDGSVKYWGTDGKCIMSHYLQQKEWISITEEGYYTCSRGMGKWIAMTSGFDSYSPEQVDKWFNRPDIIMKRLGLADTTLSKLFYQAYINRSSGFNPFSSAALQSTVLPTIVLVHPEKIPDTTAIGFLELELAVSDSLSPALKVEITVNGQPVNSVQEFKARDTVLKTTIQLSSGANNISVFAQNSSGIKSYVVNRSIHYKPEIPVRNNLYFIAFCAPEIQAKGFEFLKHAEKDGNDMAKVFMAEKDKGFFNETIQKTFYNRDAVKKNLETCRNLFMQTKIEDEIVLFFSGHGTLGTDGKFYFVTYDFDAANPARTGISLQDIEELLKGIPARKKILLLDACNSGYNSSQIELIKGLEAGGIGVLNKAAIISLLQNTFVGFNNTTGNVIIAASADNAQQNPNYENGVFTHVVRLASKDGRADTNGDGVISVNELNRYLSINIYPLSFGNQAPIIVNELPDTDFPLFHLEK